MDREGNLDTLLYLDGERLVVERGLWVRFEVKRVPSSAEKPHGLHSSLTLHDRKGERLLGFDNAHSIREGSGPPTRTRIEYDHKHKGRRIRFFDHQDAAMLLRLLEGSRFDFEGKHGATMKALRVGVLSKEAYRARTLAIATGEYVPANKHRALLK